MTDKSESLVTGILCVVVKDMGPELVANISDLGEDEAFVLATQLLTISGFAQNLEEDTNRIIGPVPIKQRKEINALLYFHQLTNKSSEDPRLVQHGSLFGIIMFFNNKKSPEIRRAIGILEPYLKRFLHQKLNSIEDINSGLGHELLTHIKEIVSKPQIRSFWYDIKDEEPRLIEYKDPRSVFRERDLVVIDEHTKEILVLTSPTTSAFESRKIYNLVNNANMNLYRNAMKIIIYESFEEIEPVLHKYGIRVI